MPFRIDIKPQQQQLPTPLLIPSTTKQTPLIPSSHKAITALATMFAGLRTATRPMVASARQARLYSTATAKAAHGPNPVMKFLKDIPVDVYPLCGLVTL